MKKPRKILCRDCGQETHFDPCQRCLDLKIAHQAATRAGKSVP